LVGEGKLVEGDRYLQQALAIIEPLSTQYRRNDDMRYVLGKTYETLAYATRARAEEASAPKHLGQALVYYRKSHALFEQLRASSPNNERYREEVSYSHKHMGAVLAKQMQWQAALEHYQASLAIDEALLKLDAGNPAKRLALTFAYSDMGYVLGQQGNANAALAVHRKVLAIRETLVASDPQNVRMRASLSYTLDAIGTNQYRMGEYRQAVESYGNALRHREIVLRADPSSKSSRYGLANTQMGLGSAYSQWALESKSPAEAQSLCRKSLNWNWRSFDGFTQLNSAGRVWVSAKGLSEIKILIAQCEQLLAKAASRSRNTSGG
jgi:tetratricopeptide (TPR) repeat protein